MKIISFIVQPDVIKKILVHLELWEEFARRRPPPLVLAAVESGIASGCTPEPFNDEWPGYEEPWLDVHSLQQGYMDWSVRKQGDLGIGRK